MRLVVTLGALALAGCVSETVQPDPQPVLDGVWGNAVHDGDLVVLVPGTGAYDYLAAPIEALPGPVPVADVRAIPKLADDAIVFEQAIAAAHKAGMTNAQLESGALTFTLWGAGFTKLSAFTYVSYEGIHVPITILGGESSCATGLILDNLVNYNAQSADVDARDLYARTAAWLAAHPTADGSPRDVVIASHSWGGAVAEYMMLEQDTIANGPLGGRLAFVMAAGVPGYILDFATTSPGVRDVSNGWLYEVDRPDDPVHALNPSGNPDGHQYCILSGDAYQGSYGITTDELSCKGVPGHLHNEPVAAA